MTALSCNFEGGSAGATISTANSGGSSGDAFGQVTVDTGNSLTYDDTQHAHGSMSARVSTGATSGSAYVAWTSGIPGTSASLYSRSYYRFGGNPAAAVNVLRMLSSSNAIMGSVRINANGTIGMLWGTGSLGGTSTAAIVAGSWWRCEVLVTAGTTTGVMIVKLYFTPDAGTPDETLTSTNVNTGSVNPTRLRAGVVSNLANVSAFNMDDLALNDAAFPGPVGGAVLLSPATETDTAQPLTRAKTRAAGTADETDGAQPLTRAKTRGLVVAGDTETALPLGRTKSRTAGVAGDTEQALPLTRAKTHTLGSAGDTETALPLTRAKTQILGPASDTELATALGRVKQRLLAAAAETDTALPLLAPGAAPHLTAATETDQALPLTATKTRTLGTATETSTAATLTRAKTRALAPAGEADQPATLDRIKLLALTAATETDIALALTGGAAPTAPTLAPLKGTLTSAPPLTGTLTPTGRLTGTLRRR